MLSTKQNIHINSVIQNLPDDVMPDPSTAQQTSIYKPKKRKDLLPLRAYILESGNWKDSAFPTDTEFINISNTSKISSSSKRLNSNDENTEPFDLNVTFFGNNWFAISQKNDENEYFNGIRKKQGIIVPDSSVVFQKRQSKIILTTRYPVRFDEKQYLLLGEPERDEFALSCYQGKCRYPNSKAVFIGSNPICDIRIKGTDFVALIAKDNHKLYIHRLTKDEILINGHKMEKLIHPLNDGDTLQIGAYTIETILPANQLQLHDYAVSAQKTLQNSLCLIGTDSTGQINEKISLVSGDSLIIGRSSKSDFVLESERVSKKHAQIIVYDNNVLVLDCYSTNGTFVNNKKIGKNRMYPSDTVTFADRHFLLGYEF